MAAPLPVAPYDPAPGRAALAQSMRAFLLGVEGDAAAMLDAAGPVRRQFGSDRSETKRGLFTTVESSGSVVEGVVGSTAPHAAVVHNGRRPGSKPPPSDVIAAWLQRKGGLSPAEARRAAFPVARSIGRRGVAGTPFLSTPLYERLPGLSGALAVGVEEALRGQFTVDLGTATVKL